jgi:hypothetical protein
MQEYTTPEIIRWLERLEAAIHDLKDVQEENRSSMLKWVLGILSAVIIFGITGLVKAFLV